MKKLLKTCLIVFGVIFGLILASVFIQVFCAKEPKTMKERIERHMSGFNGAHRGLEAHIKSTMNDPDSYQHVSTSYVPPRGNSDESVIVETTFRGKNRLGGVVTQTIRARCDISTGKVLEVISD